MTPIVFSRVVADGASKTIGPRTFPNYGSHSDNYPTAYLTAAAAVGMTKEDVELFCKRLDKVLGQWKGQSKIASEEDS